MLFQSDAETVLTWLICGVKYKNNLMYMLKCVSFISLYKICNFYWQHVIQYNLWKCPPFVHSFMRTKSLQKS